MNDRARSDRPPDEAGPPPAPDAASLAALPSDAWAWLLPHVRGALHDLAGDEVTATVRRLRAAPTSRLAGGRVRRELDALLAAGGPLWQQVVARVAAADETPAAVTALLDPDAPPAVGPTAPTGAVTGEQERTAADAAAARLRERLRTVRAERDELRRRLEGATARAAAAERDLRALERELAAARTELDAQRARLDTAAEERDRAVERERRRRDTELRELTATVTQLRRAEEERRAARRREQDARRAEAERTRGSAGREGDPRATEGPSRVIPGRPSRLPDDVVAGTTEEADLLVHPGRLVMVDGYNVTRQHRAELDLEGQRAWLVRTLATLAARRRVRPVVVFDGQRAAGTRPPSGAREVRVVFTPTGVTADDELVLAVEATDEPVVVVTDDRELTERLRASGADVIGTVPFLGVTRSG